MGIYSAYAAHVILQSRTTPLRTIDELMDEIHITLIDNYNHDLEGRLKAANILTDDWMAVAIRDKQERKRLESETAELSNMLGRIVAQSIDGDDFYELYEEAATLLKGTPGEQYIIGIFD